MGGRIGARAAKGNAAGHPSPDISAKPARRDVATGHAIGHRIRVLVQGRKVLSG